MAGRNIGRGENFREALKDAERNEAYKEWVRQRADTLRSRVTAQDVLRYFGHPLKYAGESNEEQISCPFHGKDADPSARVYPESPRSPSHVWCFVCQERWDIFGLWKKYQAQDDLRFTQVLLGLEKAFGIITPEAPAIDYQETSKRGPTEAEHEVLDLLAVCERRLKQAKPTCEMRSFLTLGKLLDELHYKIANRSIELPVANQRARAILDKIGEKIRSA